MTCVQPILIGGRLLRAASEAERFLRWRGVPLAAVAAFYIDKSRELGYRGDQLRDTSVSPRIDRDWHEGMATWRRRSGSLAYRRTRDSDGTMRGLILCPACGADRLIPLNFPIYRRDPGPEVVLDRPVAKCCTCGERIYAHVIARSRLPIDGLDSN